jgi:hypothetical protein
VIQPRATQGFFNNLGLKYPRPHSASNNRCSNFRTKRKPPILRKVVSSIFRLGAVVVCALRLLEVELPGLDDLAVAILADVHVASRILAVLDMERLRASVLDLDDLGSGAVAAEADDLDHCRPPRDDGVYKCQAELYPDYIYYHEIGKLSILLLR